jgi:hypothetical protein
VKDQGTEVRFINLGSALLKTGIEHENFNYGTLTFVARTLTHSGPVPAFKMLFYGMHLQGLI